MPFGAMLRSFGVQVGGCGGLSWRFGSLFGVYVGSCRTNGGLGGPEATGNGFGRAWVGSGAAGDPDLGPTWVQFEPSWSQLGSMVGPDRLK